jgi:predicted  nucleic acid-binding Zn-ribbon protein
MLEGCDHCGTVVEATQMALSACPECGRPLRPVDLAEAQVLRRERRIAGQFRRADRITRTGRA